MSNTSRGALLTKTHKVLKKHYKPVAPSASRSLLEHMLFACCLEGARHEAAEEAYAILQQTYFDWNEVRVTTVTELSEVLLALPDAAAAALRVRDCLQAVFETHYSFDLEFMRKQNLGKSVKDLERHKRLTPFVIGYVTQNALGGHSIPLAAGSLEVLYVIGAISEKDVRSHRAPGLERAISKSKGVEYGSLLHQLGTDFVASRHSSRVRGILLEIAADAKERLPKRGAKSGLFEPEPAKADKRSPKPPAKAGRKGAEKEKPQKPAAHKTEKTPEKKPDKKSKKPVKKAPPKGAKKAAKKTKKSQPKKKSPTKRLAKKKPR